MTTEQEQDLFLKCLLEANVDGIIAFDREYRYTTWNRAMERISGVKREEVLGKCAFDLFPCLKATGEDEFYSDALAGRSVVAENRPYTIPQSGRNGYFDGYYSPRHGETGEVVGGVAIIRDVTERKLAEASALDDHRRLAFHVENTPLAVIEWNHEFKVLRWSPAAQKLFGWKSEEVLGKRFSDWEFVVPEDLEAVNEVGHRQNRGQEHHGISRNRNFTKLGTILHCEWYNSALYNEAGKLVSVLSLVLDVTDTVCSLANSVVTASVIRAASIVTSSCGSECRPKVFRESSTARTSSDAGSFRRPRSTSRSRSAP